MRSRPAPQHAALARHGVSEAGADSDHAGARQGDAESGRPGEQRTGNIGQLNEYRSRADVMRARVAFLAITAHVLALLREQLYCVIAVHAATCVSN